MSTKLESRNASLQDLATLLSQQHDTKLDAVVPATAIRSVDGILHIHGMGLDGPVGPGGVFRPTAIMDGHFSDKLNIPTRYLRRLRDERPDLFDANVNGWLHGGGDYPADARRFLVRTFTDPDGGPGVARALLSDSYKRLDNFDVLTAALAGVRDAGAGEVDIVCDLTETRMTVKVTAPEIAVNAERLLHNYRDFRTDRYGRDYPVVWAGLVITNSETGGGAFNLVPRAVVEICTNGMTRTEDALRAVHLGVKMDEGVIRWSDETHQKNVELITAMTRDACATFLNVDYVQGLVGGIEAKSEKPLTDPVKQVELVGNQLKFSAEVTQDVLAHFIRAGDSTAGGLMQAVTSVARDTDDADLAYELEAQALNALELAYAAA